MKHVRLLRQAGVTSYAALLGHAVHAVAHWWMANKDMCLLTKISIIRKKNIPGRIYAKLCVVFSKSWQQ